MTKNHKTSQFKTQTEIDRFHARLSSILRREVAHHASLFGKADDRLSRAASALARINREFEEAAERDAAFDAGEFSGPALSRMMEEEIDEALRECGFDDYGAFEEAFAARVRVRASR